MASVTLDRVWLHLADEPATYVKCWSDRPTDSRAKTGEVRAYAAGRLRIITRAQRRQTIGLRLVDLTSDQVATLHEWAGLILMYRDETGRLIFGTFFDLTVDAEPFDQGYSTSLTFQQATYSIEV